MRAAWWWIDRWQKSTAFKDMTLAEQGAYRNLLDELWLREGLLPDDERILARLSGGPLEWPVVRTAVMAHFVRAEGGWRNETHDKIQRESRRLADKQARYRNRRSNVTGDVTGDVPRSPSPSPSPSPDQSPSPSSVPSERAADKPPRSPRPRRKPSGPHADCIRTWEAEWARTRLGQPWAWQPKDAALMAKALKLAADDPQEVMARTTRLLESGDAWLAANASPGILVSRWNQLAVSVERAGATNLLDKLLAQTEQPR